MTITLPPGVRATSYVKCVNGSCGRLPAGKAVISGSTVTLTLTDGDPQTDAGPANDGEVIDPGAPAVDVEQATLYTGSMGWSLLALVLLALWRRRRR